MCYEVITGTINSTKNFIMILFARHVDVRAMFALTTILYVCNRIVAIADGVRVMVIRKPLRYVNTTGRDPHATADALSFHRGILQNPPSWRSPLALAFTAKRAIGGSRGDAWRLARHHTYITHTAICASTMYMGEIIAGTYMPSTCAIRIELRSARTDFQCSSPSSTYPSGNSP